MSTNPLHPARLGAVALALGLALAAGCSARQPIVDSKAKANTDRKLSTFAFIEEGKLVTFIVDTKATRYRGEDAYIPLEIAIANNGLPQLRITRESFTLIDDQGNRYPAAGPEELLAHYKWLDLDRESFSELREIIFNKFATYTRYGSKFSPDTIAVPEATAVGASTTVRDHVSLPKFGYLLDFIYFPRPEGELKGRRLELFLDSPDLEQPVFVRFVVE